MTKINKDFYFTSTFKALEDENKDLIIEGLASSTSKDRVGDVILAEAWTKGGLKDYKKNPIVLFNHNYSRPVGKALDVTPVSDGLWLRAKISKAAGEVSELVKEEILRAFSVGFRIKDADYDREKDEFIITDAELFEVSVVSVPANQDAVFSLSKSFDNSKEYEEFKKQLIGQEKTDEPVKAEPSGESTPKVATTVAPKEKKIMNEEELKALMAKVAEDTAAAVEAKAAERDAARAKAAAEKAAKDAEDAKQAEVVRVAVTTAAEKLVADIEERFHKKNEELESIVNDLRGEISEKATEISQLRENRRLFGDRSGGDDWKKAHGQEVTDAYILGLVVKKDWTNTKYGKGVVEKVNQHSGVQVSSADFEQEVSTNIERDLQNELVLAPKFREIPMNAASLILPILPDAGYAEFSAAAGSGTGSAPIGNLDVRGNAYGSPFAGVALQERILTTKKLVSRSYLGNETEEDAILPILPLIRESMIRSHARAIEASLLVGNHADGPFGVAGVSYDGLIAIADADGSQSTLAGTLANNVMTAAALMGARKNMGKYGVRPSDVIYLVSQASYFELIEDPEFQDMNLVGDLATKVTGAIGQVYGSPVFLVDEFKAKSNNVFAAAAVYTRNYVRPRLRGFTVESDYDVENQRRVLVVSQRVGFIDLINGATSVWGLQYAAA